LQNFADGGKRTYREIDHYLEWNLTGARERHGRLIAAAMTMARARSSHKRWEENQPATPA
jgi:hypothetical protein